MKTVTVVCAGKLKERYWREAEAEYAKRLQAYCDLKIVETPDEKAPEKLSDALKKSILDKEGARLLKHVDADAVCIALDLRGKAPDSVAFSEQIRKIQENGDGKIAFVIGASLGLSEAVLKRANETLSLSALTFPHQMARIILLEQLYRGYRIRNHEPYHK